MESASLCVSARKFASPDEALQNLLSRVTRGAEQNIQVEEKVYNPVALPSHVQAPSQNRFD